MCAMRWKTLKRFFISLCLIFSFLSIHAEPHPTIKVGVITGAPISYQATGDAVWHGIAINLWKQIATENGWNYTFVPMGENVENAIDDLTQHKIDVLIGPITVTHTRIQKVDFSRTFLINKVVVIEEGKTTSHFASLLFMILSKVFNVIFLGVAIAFFILAHLLWIFERQYIRDFQKGYIKGMIHAVWLLLMLLIGSQLVDRPRHKMARLLILMVIILSIIFSSLVSAAFTSSLTLSLVPSANEQELSIKDIQGKNFASVQGHATGEMMQSFGGNVMYFANLSAAIQALENGTQGVNAMVGDSILLKYALSHYPKLDRLQMLPISLANNEYAFAFSRNSSLVKPFNYSLTELQDENHVVPLCLKYLSSADAMACAI